MSDKKEQKEMSELYKDRLNTPKEKWFKYEGPEQLKKMVMGKMEEEGLKFKDKE